MSGAKPSLGESGTVVDAGSASPSLRIGMIGVSAGNGHPFSFSAVVNGYSDEGLKRSGWPVIHEYVTKRPDGDFGFPDVKVTHVWTQDPVVTQRLREACLIPHAVGRAAEMIGGVDAVIIARDDPESHAELALPFLKAGLPVFVDKPLCLEAAGLRTLRPYLENGTLMSASGARYAPELDGARASIADYGPIKLIRGAVVNGWEKYGIHVVDGVLSVVASRPTEVLALAAPHDSAAVSMSDGSLFQIDALGNVPRTFRIDIWGERKASSHEITDSFTCFRRLLAAFIESVRSGRPAIPPEDTMGSMRLLIAGRLSRAEKRKVRMDEIRV